MARRLLASVAALALLAGCQTTREREAEIKPELARTYLADKPDALKRHFYVSLTQGQRNRVLNDMRIALAAMEMGLTPLAVELFDDALMGIEAVYAGHAEAAKARGLFVKELNKDFKGEPYERAMAYYYRGLLYLKEGDYDNARASFKGGLLQDSFAEEEQNRADFALLAYLQGWASRCAGNAPLAAEDFAEFGAIDASFPQPGENENVLVLVETGSAPVKFSTADPGGSKGKYLRMKRASATESAIVRIPEGGSERAEAARLIEDVYRQAATRGGREFDAILEGKAQFKDATDTVGTGLILGGAAMLQASDDSRRRNERQRSYNPGYQNPNGGGEAEAAAALVGLGLILAGAVAKGISEATEAEADTRYWDNLPDRVHALALELPPNVGKLTVDFLDSEGVVMRTREAKVERAGRCGLAWVRGYSAFPPSPRAPSSAPLEVMSTPVELPAETAPAQVGRAETKS